MINTPYRKGYSERHNTYLTRYTGSMATKSNQSFTPSARHKGTFVERYPDYPSWLDGDVWELDIENEIHESLAAFRASLYYQAKELTGSGIATKTVRRTREDGTPYKVLLVQALDA